jgi:hypothetical protein
MLKLNAIERKLGAYNKRSVWLFFMAAGAGFVAAAVPNIQNQWWMAIIGIIFGFIAWFGYRNKLPVDLSFY